MSVNVSAEILSQESKEDVQLNITGARKSNGLSSFEKALNSWTEVNLPTLQQQLDDKGLLLNELQTKSLESRKILATKTKEFRKLEDQLKLKEFKSLLKLYQQEVDALTERSKQAESSFFDVYGSIGELPDPKPLLEASLDSVIVSQEIDELRSKNNNLQEELLKFADYDQLKAKLLRLEQKSSETLNNRLKMKEEELLAVFQEKESNWSAKEENFNQKCKDYEKKVENLLMQQKIDQIKLKNQRMALGVEEEEDVDEDRSFERAEGANVRAKFDQVQKDFEYQRSLNNKLEKRNEELIKELSLAKSDNLQIEAKLTKELKLNELESENATLVATLDHLKQSGESKSRKSQLMINNLQRDVTTLSGEISTLKKKLVKYKDYEDIKQELNTLRQISFGTGEDEESESDDDDVKKLQENLKNSSSNGGGNSDIAHEKLDEILINRNKKLTQEIIDLRLKCEELQTKVTNLQQESNQFRDDAVRLSELNNKLELDLSHFQSAVTTTNNPRFDSMSMVSGVGKLNSHNNRAASIVSIDEGEQSSGNNLSSVLPIVTAQRDRFRSRNLELETQLKAEQNKIKDLEGKIKKLTKDNAELFERTRYLSSFNKGSVHRPGQQQHNLHDIDLEKHNQYEKNYEESLNPLTKFREREQERISSKLSPLERVFLGFARAILANKTSRLLFLGYCAGLHGLVMLMTFYVMSLHGSLTPDVGLVEKTSKMAGANLGTRS